MIRLPPHLRVQHGESILSSILGVQQQPHHPPAGLQAGVRHIVGLGLDTTNLQQVWTVTCRRSRSVRPSAGASIAHAGNFIS